MAERRGGSGVSEWIRGVVQNTNPNGVKLEGEDWLNWSQYAPEGERVVPAKGTKVKLGLDNRGFLREVQDEQGNKLTPGSAGTAAPGAYGGSMKPEDQWRVTLLSTLSSAASLMQTMADDQLAGRTRSAATWELALHWAKQAWTQPMPEKPRNRPEADDAGDE